MVTLVCPACRAARLTSSLTASRSCGACGARFEALDPGGGGPPVNLLLHPEDADAGRAAAQRVLAALEQGAGFRREQLEPQDEGYLSALSLYGHAHWGTWAEPARASADVSWLSQQLIDADLPAGPVLLVGAACGGESVHVPQGHEVVVLDGSVPLLAVGARLANQDFWLPQAETPGRYRPARICVPPETQDVLRRATWIAADARDPPLAPGSFAAVVALNVLDSVSHPARVLGAAAELVAPGGALLCSSPFNWSDEVTPPSRRLEPAEIPAVVGALELREHRCAVPWEMQVHDRLRLSYALEVFRFRRPPLRAP